MDTGSELDDLDDAIESGNEDLVLILLNDLPLRSLDKTTIYSLLVHLLETAIEGGERTMPMARICMDFFSKTNESEEKISTFSQLFLNQIASTDLLKILSDEFIEHAHDEIALEIMDYDDRPEITSALVRLTEVYGRRSYLEAELLQRQAVDKKCTRAANFYLHEMATQSPFNKIPEWIIKEKDEDYPYKELMSNDQLIKSLDKNTSKKISKINPNIDKRAKELADQLEAQGIIADKTTMIELLRRQLAVANNIDRQAWMDENMDLTREQIGRFVSGQERQDWFQILGPVNIITGADLEGDDICAKFGGCRMLTCNCFERDSSRAGLSFYVEGGIEDDDEIEHYVDWFMFGRCQNESCKTPRILSRAYAIREPLPHGGWMGCYCSPQCLKESLSSDDATNALTTSVIDRVVDQLYATGIFDRLHDTRPSDEDNPVIITEPINKKISKKKKSKRPIKPTDEAIFVSEVANISNPTIDEFDFLLNN